jgi:threonine/homoserine/homoserine lactone efflux protein
LHDAATILLTIALLWFAAAVAPGPNFFLTTRTALLKNRAAGIQTALGIACGATIWGLAGFFGVHTLFALAPRLYLLLKLGGSAYLIVLGAKFLIGSSRAGEQCENAPRRTSSPSAMRMGVFTSVCNPQSALSTTSLFAAALPAHPSIGLGLSAVFVMTAVAATWYIFVACVLTIRPAAAAFMRIRHWVDRIAGLAFLGFGAKLALER